MAYADIVLPACTYYETESYMVYDSVFRIREQLAAPVNDARYDFLILAELAARLGYGHLFPQDTESCWPTCLTAPASRHGPCGTRAEAFRRPP